MVGRSSFDWKKNGRAPAQIRGAIPARIAILFALSFLASAAHADTASAQNPFWNSFSDRQVDENQSVTFRIEARDNDFDRLRFYHEEGDTVVCGQNNPPVPYPWFSVQTRVNSAGLYRADVRLTPGFDDGGSYPGINFGVTDGTGGCAERNITITINNVNRAPVGMNDAATVEEDQSVTIDVLANDTDPDGDALSIGSFTQPAAGVVAQAGSSLRYMPPADFDGQISFTYEASDGQALSSAATVTVTVTPVNDPPVLQPIGNQSTVEGVRLEVPLAANDPEGNGLIYSLSGAPPFVGIAGDDGRGNAVLRIDPGFSDAGTYQNVRVTVSDDGSLPANDSETFDINITYHQNNPTAVISSPAPGTYNEGATITLDGSASHSNPSGSHPIAFTWSKPGSLGGTIADPNSAVTTWTLPAVSSDQSAQINLLVRDQDNSRQFVRLVAFTIKNVINQAPVADASLSDADGYSGVLVQLNGSASSDPDGDSLTYLWRQTGGTPVTLLLPLRVPAPPPPPETLRNPRFIAPLTEANGTTVTFELVVTDPSGVASAPAVWAVNIVRGPGKITDLTADDASAAHDSIALKWTAPAAQAALDHYVIQLADHLDSSGNFPADEYLTTAYSPVPIAQPGQEQSARFINGSLRTTGLSRNLAREATYFIRVKAVDANGGESVYSDPIEARTKDDDPPSITSFTLNGLLDLAAIQAGENLAVEVESTDDLGIVRTEAYLDVDRSGFQSVDGSGIISSAAFTIPASIAGVMDVVVRAVDTSGHVTIESKTIEVTPDPAESPNLELTAENEIGESPLIPEFIARASSASGRTVIQYRFDFDGDGIIDHTINEPDGAERVLTYYNAPGRYTARVFAVDDNNMCVMKTQEITAQDPAGEQFFIQLNRTMPPECQDSNVCLAPFGAQFDVAAGSRVKEIQWFVNGELKQASPQKKTFSYEFTEVGTYEVKARVTNLAGAAREAAADIRAKSEPNGANLYPSRLDLSANTLRADFSASTENDSGTVVFTDLSVSNHPIVSYEWDWEGDGVYDLSGDATIFTVPIEGPFAGSAVVKHRYTQPGFYHPALRVTMEDRTTGPDAYRLSDRFSRTIEISSLDPSFDPVHIVTPKAGDVLSGSITISTQKIGIPDHAVVEARYLLERLGPLGDPLGSEIELAPCAMVQLLTARCDVNSFAGTYELIARVVVADDFSSQLNQSVLPGGVLEDRIQVVIDPAGSNISGRELTEEGFVYESVTEIAPQAGDQIHLYEGTKVKYPPQLASGPGFLLKVKIGDPEHQLMSPSVLNLNATGIVRNFTLNGPSGEVRELGSNVEICIPFAVSDNFVTNSSGERIHVETLIPVRFSDDGRATSIHEGVTIQVPADGTGEGSACFMTSHFTDFGLYGKIEAEGGGPSDENTEAGEGGTASINNGSGGVGGIIWPVGGTGDAGSGDAGTDGSAGDRDGVQDKKVPDPKQVPAPSEPDTGESDQDARTDPGPELEFVEDLYLEDGQSRYSIADHTSEQKPRLVLDRGDTELVYERRPSAQHSSFRDQKDAGEQNLGTAYTKVVCYEGAVSVRKVLYGKAAGAEIILHPGESFLMTADAVVSKAGIKVERRQVWQAYFTKWSAFTTDGFLRNFFVKRYVPDVRAKWRAHKYRWYHYLVDPPWLTDPELWPGKLWQRRGMN